MSLGDRLAPLRASLSVLVPQLGVLDLGNTTCELALCNSALQSERSGYLKEITRLGIKLWPSLRVFLRSGLLLIVEASIGFSLVGVRKYVLDFNQIL